MNHALCYDPSSHFRIMVTNRTCPQISNHMQCDWSKFLAVLSETHGCVSTEAMLPVASPRPKLSAQGIKADQCLGDLGFMN